MSESGRARASLPPVFKVWPTICALHLARQLDALPNSAEPAAVHRARASVEGALRVAAGRLLD